MRSVSLKSESVISRVKRTEHGFVVGWTHLGITFQRDGVSRKGGGVGVDLDKVSGRHQSIADCG